VAVLRSVFVKTLLDQRRLLLGWTIGISAVGVLYAGFYPTVNTPEMRAALDAYPQAVLDAIGFVDVSTAAGYVGATSFGILGSILIVIFAAAVGSGAIAGEEESGRLDLLLAHPVTRWSVLLQRFAALVVGMLLVTAVLCAALLAIAGLFQLDSIGVANMAAASIHLAALGTCFGALALAAGAALGRRGAALGLLAIVGVGTYFGNNLAGSVDAIAWMRDVSPFRYYSGGMPLVNGLQLGDVAVLVVASVVLVGLGGLAFNRRDVAV
jgi:ABC-2 type transport system permease protein